MGEFTDLGAFSFLVPWKEWQGQASRRTVEGRDVCVAWRLNVGNAVSNTLASFWKEKSMRAYQTLSCCSWQVGLKWSTRTLEQDSCINSCQICLLTRIPLMYIMFR